MTRLLSGLVLIAVVLAAVLAAPAWLFLALLVVFVALGFGEYAALAAATGLSVPRVEGAVAAVVLTTAVALDVPLVLALSAVALALGIVALGRHAPAPHVPGSAAAGLFGAVYVGVPLGLVAVIRDNHGPKAVLFVILTVIASDTAQFYVGSTFGRHRLAPAVSPKKSVEGALGGLAAAAIVSACFGDVAWPALGPGWLAAIGLLIAALGIAGDLFESLLKRSADVKDSSQLIPGHGGVLDRIDALLFAVPGCYLLLRFLN